MIGEGEGKERGGGGGVKVDLCICLIGRVLLYIALLQRGMIRGVSFFKDGDRGGVGGLNAVVIHILYGIK